MNVKKRVNAFKYALEGIVSAFKTEVHLKVHLLAALVVVNAGFYFHITKTEWCFILLCCALVISLELINSAVEKLTDSVFKDVHPNAKYIKDVAAGAVLVASIVSVVIAVIIFCPYILR
jgi:diacylglycerol kinase